MTKVYIVEDQVHEICLGAFSSEEKAMQMIEATEFLGDELTWTEYEIDETLSRLNMLKEMKERGEKIYHLSSRGTFFGDKIVWGKWWINTLITTAAIEYTGNTAHEFSIKNINERSRYATIRACSEEDAIKIALEIMVQL